MSRLKLTQEGLCDWLRKFQHSHRLYGPAWTGSYYEFLELEDPGKIDWSYSNTRLSPKELFHPPSEKMFEFHLSQDRDDRFILKEVPKDYRPTIVAGIRPCDAYAMKLMDINFDTDQYKDPFWVNRRQNSVIIGYGCNNPCPTCFCKSVGSGPFDKKGVDILVINLGKAFVVDFVTEKGRELLRKEPIGAGALSKDEEKQLSEFVMAAESSMPVLWDRDLVSGRPMTELFNADFWEELQFSCINCGVCTFLCPTCWCFDIQDEVYKEKGCRIRLWDSCMFPLFTLHGSGHNPRSQKLQRVRQRFMHKLKYYVDKYKDGVACVGCGRCVQYCPVNIDIRDVMRIMVSRCQCAM